MKEVSILLSLVSLLEKSNLNFSKYSAANLFTGLSVINEVIQAIIVHKRDINLCINAT